MGLPVRFTPICPGSSACGKLIQFSMTFSIVGSTLMGLSETQPMSVTCNGSQT